MNATMLLIVNPTARGGETGVLVPALERLLGAIKHDTVFTACPGHALDLASRALGYETVVAVGGDGTVHEVINGLMRIPAHARPSFGLIPSGSGNDTARMLNIPLELARAALVLSSGLRRDVDVGMCNETCFSNSFATGLDARVNARAIQCKTTTRRRGLWLYLTSLMHVLFHDLGAEHVRLTWDGSRQQPADALIVAVTNGPTYGGGFHICPGAVCDDGLLDVCVIDPLSLPQALIRLPFVIIGRHTRMKPVHMARASSLVIESDTPLPAQVDGEVYTGTRFEISVMPRAIRCIVPQPQESAQCQ